MTIIDTNKDTVDPMGIPNRDTTFTNKSDGQKSHEQTASTDAGQAIKPSDDDDLFDNMPV
tara:strand:- start:3155 stop:3334 length:180 start_codon:yes stop_codon:yes gene_type:complete